MTFDVSKTSDSKLKFHTKDTIGEAFKDLRRSCGVVRSVNFYGLRHTFRTIADESRDTPAINLVMGHSPDGRDMATRYVERIAVDRLKAVSDHVRNWLFSHAD